MFTFQDLYEEVQDLTGDDSTSATTKHKLRINNTYKKVLRKFNKRTETTGLTVASQQTYELPRNCNKITSIKVTISSIDYPLEEIINEEEWNVLNDQGTGYTSDIPTNFYIKDNNVLLFPTPSTDGYTITFYYTLTDRDLSVDNYTTGKILTLPYTTTFTAIVAVGAVSATLSGAWGLATGSYQIVFSNNEVRAVTLTNASTAVTWTTGLTAAATASITVNNAVGGSIVVGGAGGDAPTWTALMVGRWLKVTNDGFWYKIYSYLSATTITLEKKFVGTAIAVGSSAHTIAEIPQLPEEYQEALIFYPCFEYFLGKREMALAGSYKTMFDEIYKNIKPEEDKTTSVIVKTGIAEVKNINDYPRI